MYYYRKGQGVQVKVQKEETRLSLRKNLVHCFLRFFLDFQISYISYARWIILLYFLCGLRFIIGVCGYIYFG